MTVQAAGRKNPYEAQREAKEQRMHEMTRISIQEAIKEGRIDDLPAFYRTDPHYADLFPPKETDIFTAGKKEQDVRSYDEMDTEADGMATHEFEAEG